MKNIWSIACHNSVIDQDTNSLSIFESLECINVSYRDKIDLKEIKIIPISFQIASLWIDKNTKTDRKFDLLVEVLDWQGKSIKQFNQECVIPTKIERLRAITKISGFGVTNQGEYTLVVKYKENKKLYKIVSEIPIDIKFSKI